MENVKREHGYHRARIIYILFVYGGGAIRIVVSTRKDGVYLIHSRYCKAITHPPHIVFGIG